MMPTIYEVLIIVDAPYTTVLIRTSEMQLDALYALYITNVKNPDGRIIKPAASTKDFVGTNTAPTLVSATVIDSTHLDIVFSKEMLDEPLLVAMDNYIIQGEINIVVSNAVLDADNVTVHLTLSESFEAGNYTIFVMNAVDAGYNVLNSDYDTIAFSYP